MKNLLNLLTLLFLGISLPAYSQVNNCDCTNCPVSITDNGNFNGNIFIQNTGPNILGVNNCLDQVCFTVTHTWIGDLDFVLTAPDGTSYIIMGDLDNDAGGCGTNCDNLNVCINLGTGNPAGTGSSEYGSLPGGGGNCVAGNFTIATGVTNPNGPGVAAPGGNLNAFNNGTGTVSGMWTLTIGDNCSQDVGQLTNWSMSFCDESGINCSSTPLCIMNSINANVGPCIPATGNYNVTGQLSFSNPPAGGQLIVAGCGGVQQVFNPPFVSPINYSLVMPANGAACNVTASFTSDPACTINAGGFTAPTCPCIVNNFTANIGACNPATNTYQVTGQVQFTSPPAGGQLIVENCDGVQQVFNPPFVSPLNYTLNSCVPNGTACDVQAYFTALPACQQTINFTEPTPCNCVADAGTYNANIVGVSTNNYVLCWSDQINITSNNNYTFPADVNDPTIPYNPGIFYLIYSCLPTPGVLPSADPCFEGIAGLTPNFNDVNDLTMINSFAPGTFTNNTVYYVPSTMYDIVGMPYYISVTDYAADCFDLGTPFSVTYLPEITYVSAENCNNGTATFTINGGHPSVYGTNFTASGLTPASASFGNTTCGNAGNIVINGLQDGDMYSFTITDANGCPVTCSGGPYVEVSDATITPAGPFCPGDSAIQLTAVDGGGTWSATCGACITPGGIFDPAIAGAGTYTITYTIPGVCGDVQNTSITVNPVFNATITPQPAVCIDAAAVVFTAATPGGTWSASCGACINSVTGSIDPAVAGAGPHVITYTLAGACGSSDTENFTVNALPNAIAGNTGPVCEGVNVGLTSNGGTGYAWQGPLGYNSAVQNPTIPTANPSQTGTYTVTVTDANNCSSTATTFLTVNALPLVLANSNAPQCDGDNVTLNGNGAFNYTWVGPNGFNQNGQSPVINNISVADNGVYTVTGTDANNCSATATVNVVSWPLPTSSFVGDNLTGCAPLCVNFTDQSNGNGGVINTWNWNIQGQAPVNTQNAAVCFPSAGTYDATLTVTTADGCVGTLTLPNYITVNPNPVADFLYAPQEILESDPEVNFASTSINAVNWSWNFGDGATALTENPLHMYQDTGIFCITLVVTSNAGCVDTATGCLYVKPEYTLFIPNTFTVNGDGLNEIWQVYGRGVKTIATRIFDRWGEEIYFFDTLDKGWPGTKQNGTPVKQDVYVYRIEVIDSKGDPHTYLGNVNLIR